MSLVYFTRIPTGTVIGQREAGGANSYYVHPDALGSTVNVTNASGVEQSDWEYDPYGQLLSSSTGNPPVNWRYAGQYRSEPLSLYKMGHRFYDPKIGRWTQQDPIDQSSDLHEGNRYSYVGGNPVNFTDPRGLALSDYYRCLENPTCRSRRRTAHGYAQQKFRGSAATRVTCNVAVGLGFGAAGVRLGWAGVVGAEGAAYYASGPLCP